MSSTKKKTDAEVLRAIDHQALDDALGDMEAMSSEELAALIASEGGDAAGIASRGKLQGEKLLEQRTRLAWHKAAQERIDKVRALAAATTPSPALPRVALLLRIESARRHPRLAQPIAVAFRKRSAEESSDEELATLLEEIELLRKVIGEDS